MFLGSAWPDNPKTFHSQAVHIIGQGGRLTLKIAAVVFLLLAVMALEAAGALGTSDQPMREVDAGEILAKVEAGQPVEYDHVVVRGDLDLSRERLQKNITTLIRINDSIFKDLVSFNGSILEMPVDLSNSNFTKDIYFIMTTFRGYAHFRGATFKSYAGFEFAIFRGEAYFENATFCGNANFLGTTFSGNAGFEEASFVGDAGFFGATFSGNAGFEEASFVGDAGFFGATFSGYAGFENATFSVEAVFMKAMFRGDAYFGGATFRSYANFMDAAFSGDADFMNSTFGGNAYFCRATFDGEAFFLLASFIHNSSFENAEFNGNAEFGDARFENETSFYRILFKRPAYFEDCSINSLDLTKAEYGRLHLRWDDITNLHFDEAAYLALIKNYNTLGWYGDANWCYYDYRNAVRKDWHAPSSGFAARLSSLLDRLIDSGEWLLYGYGVRPLFPILWSFIIISFFCLFFWQMRCLRKIVINEKIETDKDASLEVLVRTVSRVSQIKFLDYLLFSLFTFIPGLKSLLHPNIEYKLERCLRWAIVERLLGSFFLALVITTISKTYLIR